MSSIFVTIIVIVFIILGFYVVCKIVSIYTGCTTAEAAEKVHNWLSDRQPYSLENDSGFMTTIDENCKNILQEENYNFLIKLTKTRLQYPIICFGVYDSLSAVLITLKFSDESEKQLCEHVLSNVLKDYLVVNNKDCRIIPRWIIRKDINLPVLVLKYANDSKQKQVLERQLQMRENIATYDYSEVKDDDLF